MEKELSNDQKQASLGQNLQQIPAEAYAITAILGLCVLGIYPWWTACLLLVIGYVIYKYIMDGQALEKAKANAATYANCIGPILIRSMRPNETKEELEERAEEWRQNLSLSGNPYAGIIPVVIYPYNAMLLAFGQMSSGWSIYQRMCGEKQYELDIAWHQGKCPANLKAQFASQVLPAPKNQEEL